MERGVAVGIPRGVEVEGGAARPPRLKPKPDIVGQPGEGGARQVYGCTWGMGPTVIVRMEREHVVFGGSI